jgi:succinyl-CoA synthetase alpha subunit
MGHAGAIVGADGRGNAENKEKALRTAGCYIADNTEQLANIVASLLKGE